MSGGRASRQKGNRREREIVALLRAIGCEAQRVPLSGSAGGKFKDDVTFATPTNRVAMQAEVKARANGEGFATIERWLGDADALFLIRDRASPMVVLPWTCFEKLVRLG